MEVFYRVSRATPLAFGRFERRILALKSYQRESKTFILSVIPAVF